ncbi:MFS transporter [Streptomyces wuyuanensis]|uniref:hypothetical protein n=1 Tax=Streptomyces wuyuanensis TaxID=1196353 RepID=UPI00381C498D
MFTLALLTLNRLLGPAGFGKAAGIVTAVNGGLAGVDAIAGGQIADAIGFRGIFVRSALIAVAGLLGVRRYVPDGPPAATGGRFDSRGIAALSLGLAGVLVGLAQGSTWGWTSPLTLGFLLGGIASLVFFVISRKFRHRPGDRPRGPGLPPRLAAADHHVLHPRRDRPHHPARRPVPRCGPRSVGRDRCRPLPRPDPAHRSRLGPAGRPDRSEDRLAQGSSSPERPPTSRSSSSRPSSCTTSGS